MPRKSVLKARKEVRFTPDQLLMVEEWCKQIGVDSSTYIRQKTLEGMRRDMELATRPAYTQFGICVKCGYPCAPGTTMHQACLEEHTKEDRV